MRRLLLIATMFTVTLPLFAQNATVIHAGRLLSVPGESDLTNQTIVVENGRIVAVRDGFLSPADAGVPEAKVVDLRDHTVIPGLMDMHTT